MPDLTITEAAERLGKKPWEVVRLIENGRLPAITLIAETSLTEYQEQQ